MDELGDLVTLAGVVIGKDGLVLLILASAALAALGATALALVLAMWR